MVFAKKNPAKVRAGRLGARKRWGDPGVVRLDALTPAQRRLVLALVEAARNEKAVAVIETPATAKEARRVSVEPSES